MAHPKKSDVSMVRFGNRPALQIIIPLNNTYRDGHIYNVVNEKHTFRKAVLVDDDSDIKATVVLELNCRMELTPQEGEIIDTILKKRRTAVHIS